LSESRLDDVGPSTPHHIRDDTLLNAARKHPETFRELARRFLAGDIQGTNAFQFAPTNGVVPQARASSQLHPNGQMHDLSRVDSDTDHADNHARSEDSDGYGDVDEPTEALSSEDGDAPAHHIPSEFFYQPSLPQLLRDASTFNSYRQQNEVKRLFSSWLERAKQNQHNAVIMEQIAVEHDRSTLLRQAVEIWRACLLQKHREAQTERFFKHLEERAGKARDLYLLTKVFTHWEQVTSDEVQKTSEAREHILRLKYFNAWRQLTAINELKVQRFMLKKPFNHWVRKLRQHRSDEMSAVQVYERNSSKQLYWHWFWSFCYRRAPQWREYRLKQRFLVIWLRNFRALRECELEVENSRKRRALQSSFRGWSQRSQAVTRAQADAEALSRTKFIKDNFVEWRIQRHLRAASAQVSSMVKSRILRSSFGTWSLRTRMEIQAREIDRARVLRNAWTVWNDRLRYQALSRRIDERVVVQALYKWVLMERYHLMTRIHQQRVKKDALDNLMGNSQGIYTHLLRQEEQFRAHRKRELLRQTLFRWQTELQVRRQHDLIAREFYSPRVEHDALSLWKHRMQHLKEMSDWATKARFYLLTKPTIGRWHAATVDAAKKRKENAYMMVRRKVKVNLVTAAITSWRTQTGRILELQRQADDFYRVRLIRKATALFDLWAKQTSHRMEHIHDSDTYYRRQLAYNALTHWTGSFRSRRAEEEKAMQFSDIHVTRLAVAHIRKLSLRLFQIRTSSETADAQYDRNARKRLKTMLRHWNERAQEARSSRPEQTYFAATKTTPAPSNDQDQDVFDEKDEWKHVDGTLNIDELLSQPNWTPRTPIPATPAYLHSPSERALRARSLAQMSTTPATPSRTPFAARLLSQRMTTGPRGSSTKKTFVPRSALGTTVRFAVDDEAPESPTDARRSLWASTTSREAPHD
jgi:protein SFI1